MNKIILIVLLSFVLLFTGNVYADSNSSFVSIVNPVRGEDFWDQKDQGSQVAVLGQMEILRQLNVPVTWLIRPDALNNQKITDLLNKNFKIFELGLFLEVTPSWTNDANVVYRKSKDWHAAGSVLLTAYERGEREKLIDAAFAKFNKIFNFYPKSVGAWWIDAYSLEYMEKKYGITATLIVSDQYTTDNYQIWGQYFSTPYYPSKNNALHPAQTRDSKLPVVIMQWGARDPLNSYGNGVYESTFSVQANDYLTFHDLNINYFSNLLDIYTKQPLNKFGHMVVGLENSYSWSQYHSEYENQIKTLLSKQKMGQLTILTMADFASWYKKSFPTISPEHIIVADDPLGSDKKVVWFMNPYYRAGWFFNQDGSVFRDIRQYIDGEEELCYIKSCSEVNFATFSTRVLDEVSFGHKWVIDEGKISDFKVVKENDKYILNYKNEGGKNRIITFLPRDIAIDGKIYSIDTAILQTTQEMSLTKKESGVEYRGVKWTLSSLGTKTIKYTLFLIFALIIPGLVLTRKISNEDPPFYQRIFLSIVCGIVSLTLAFYIVSILKVRLLVFLYLLIFLILFIRFRIFFELKPKFTPLKGTNFLLVLIILSGTIFQSIPVFKNGLTYPYGLGFWGPNTHDGVWHMALINQLVKEVPPQNPIFANETLKNYHYFYDLLIAVTNFFTKIDVSDLIFRFYPAIFSLMLGVGSYYLVMRIFKDRIGEIKTNMTAIFSLYLVYFAGSFGWIVEYIKYQHLGGESAFWANQSISFNLNPPFAISILIIISILQILPNIKKLDKWTVVNLTILCGSLLAFKSYGGVLILGSLLLVGIIKKSLSYLIIFLTSFLVSAFLFIPNFSLGKLLIFAPFWFIHSMVDSADRVGWVRLSLARTSGLEQGNWFKFITSEVISLTLFIVGNLGTRLFALFSLKKVKNIFNQTFYLTLFVFSFLSLLIPILFIQAGNPWNTIQFLYYFLYIAGILGGIAFAKIVGGINKLFAIPIILIFLIITPINSWATANGYLSYQPHALITDKELEALQFLKAKDDGVVLTQPYDDRLKKRIAEPWPLFAYDSTAYVSAFSQKAVFIEDEIQNQILLIDYKKRIVLSKDFFKGATNPNFLDKKFLIESKIKYIYIPKIFKIRVSEDSEIKKIFENEEVVIYQFQSQ